MQRRGTWLLAVFALLAVRVGEVNAEQPVDACAKRTCRELTAPERTTMGRLLDRLMSSLTLPGAARFESSGMRSVHGLGSFLLTDSTWEDAEYPANIVDSVAAAWPGGAFPRSCSVVYTYMLKNEGERHAFRDFGGALAGGTVDIFDLRLQASILPAPAVPPSSADPENPDTIAAVETKPDVLVVETLTGLPKRLVSTTLIGARVAEGEGEPAGGDIKGLARPRAVKVEIEGPPKDVRELAKKIDRRAMLAVLRGEGSAGKKKGKQ